MGFEIGQVVGSYQVIGVLGAGGMGSVYKVRNRISDRVDAMKVVLHEPDPSSQHAERFLNEIKVLASLNHPNIAAMYTAFEIDGNYHLIMEFVDGVTLSKLAANGPLGVAEAVSCIYQVLTALSYAHARGVVHRDIKPANIAIDPQRIVKLLDFGLARDHHSPQLTPPGAVLGSLHYMAPEQVRGQPATSRSDIYSTSASLYRAITGQRPIDGANNFQVMRAHLHEMPVSPRKHIPDLSPELSDIVMRGLAKDPADRYRTAEDFRRALEPYLPNAATPPAPLPRDESTRTMMMVGMMVAENGQTPGIASRILNDPARQAALGPLEQLSAKWLGPVAGALVRRHSATAVNLPELCGLLANEISSPVERQAFLKACARRLGHEAVIEPTSVHLGPPSPDGMAWDPALLEGFRKRIGPYLGPLAGVIVDRAARQAHNENQLFQILADAIPGARDREAFIASVRGPM